MNPSSQHTDRNLQRVFTEKIMKIPLRSIDYPSRGMLYYDHYFIERGSGMIYQPREEGQGLVEYALILVLVAVVVIVILALLGPAIGNIFSNIIRAL